MPHPVIVHVLILLFVLALLPSAAAEADAGISRRIESLSLRIEQNPDDQSLRLQRARAFMEDNQPALALSDIQVAETLGDPVAAAHTHGVLLYRQRELEAALPYFNRYLQAFPADWSALGYRARLLRDLGQNRLALADYEALLRLNEDLDPGYYVATARLIAGQPGRGVDDALALLDARMLQRGMITSLQRYAIELERQRRNYDAAIARMATLDEKLRATPQWHLDVAELLLQAERPADAMPYLVVAREQLQAARATVVNQRLQQQAQRLQQTAEQMARQAEKEPPPDEPCATCPRDPEQSPPERDRGEQRE